MKYLSIEKLFVNVKTISNAYDGTKIIQVILLMVIQKETKIQTKHENKELGLHNKKCCKEATYLMLRASLQIPKTNTA